MTEKQFIITINSDVSKEELRKYIKEAVEAWGGAYEKDHPLFSLHNKVKVRAVTKYDSIE